MNNRRLENGVLVDHAIVAGAVARMRPTVPVVDDAAFERVQKLHPVPLKLHSAPKTQLGCHRECERHVQGRPGPRSCEGIGEARRALLEICLHRLYLVPTADKTLLLNPLR
jgi:hypothetical protein